MFYVNQISMKLVKKIGHGSFLSWNLLSNRDKYKNHINILMHLLFMLTEWMYTQKE